MGDLRVADPQAEAPSFERHLSMDGFTPQPEDKSAMTIEFLRARLLAERSTSRAAQQQAQQLATKVTELEQRIELEMNRRRNLEGLREKDGDSDLFKDRISDDGYVGSQPENSANTFRQNDSNSISESFMGEGSPGVSDEHVSELCVPAKDGDEADDGDGRNNLTGSRKGILYWTGLNDRNKRQLHLKEWVQSPTDLMRNFSPRSFGSMSPDSVSPSKRWSGKSVRQIRSRSFSLKADEHKETDDHFKDVHRSDACSEEYRMHEPDHQIEEHEIEGKQQRIWNPDLQEQMNFYSGQRHEEDKQIAFTELDEQVPKDKSERTETAETADGFVMHQTAEDETLLKNAMKDTHCSVGRLPVADYEANNIMHVDTDGCQLSQGPPSEVIEAIEEDNRNIKSSTSASAAASCDGKSITQNSVIDRQEILDDPSETVEDDMEDGINMSQAELMAKVPAYVSSDEQKKGVQDDNFSSSTTHQFYNNMVLGFSLSEESLDQPEENKRSSDEQVGSIIPYYPQRSIEAASERSSFYASSNSSNQGSTSSLDKLSYRKEGIPLVKVSGYPRTPEAISREGSQNTLKKWGYTVESPSPTREDDDIRKSRSYRDRAWQSFHSSSGHKSSNIGSSKGLMNSSWDEIFNKKIRSQAEQNAKVHGTLSREPFPSFNDSTQPRLPPHHIHTPRKQNPMEKKAFHHQHPYSSPQLPNTYERRHPSTHIHGKSMDAGLDRVMEVLRALEIAKQQVESSNEPSVYPLKYSAHSPPNVSPYHPSWSPTRNAAPFIYNMEDEYQNVFQQRTPTSIHSHWNRDEPRGDWRGSYYGYPSYQPQYR
ncbi:hypothetical protein KP509_13G027800 [Ceratopteris richardii]|uniref:Uncharacterized protein n=1 Tax=Ceratopteris richardii TaxID=49495 RepID=A0A8T2TEA4_CERRI|nr:hypothetical protein KP509_13G027800 [Ceratopteris richardii]